MKAPFYTLKSGGLTMYEDIKYGGFYTVTGKSKYYVYISGTDERGNGVSGGVPKNEFYKTFKRWKNEN